MTDHDDLRKLAEAATPGPWKRGKTNDFSKLAHVSAPGVTVCAANLDDAAYIAAMSPEVTLELLDGLKAAQEQVAQLREALQGFAGLQNDHATVAYVIHEALDALAATEPKAKE